MRAGKVTSILGVRFLKVSFEIGYEEQQRLNG